MAALPAIVLLFIFASESAVRGQDISGLAEQVRSGTAEEKRSALFELRNLQSIDASRAALPALQDPDPVVRATAAGAAAFLPPSEAAPALLPLLDDKEAFVRKEAAYALGRPGNTAAVGRLSNMVRGDKDLEVRAAAAIALGKVGDPLAVRPLLEVLRGPVDEETEFLRRSAARAIGSIAQFLRSGSVYIVTPQNFLPERFKTQANSDAASESPLFRGTATELAALLTRRGEVDDVRREIAFAIGAIGGREGIDELRRLAASPDPYQAEIAEEALLKMP